MDIRAAHSRRHVPTHVRGARGLGQPRGGERVDEGRLVEPRATIVEPQIELGDRSARIVLGERREQ
jgi:hypothetical protein